MRPGIEPAPSWILVGFFSAVPQWELPGLFLLESKIFPIIHGQAYFTMVHTPFLFGQNSVPSNLNADKKASNASRWTSYMSLLGAWPEASPEAQACAEKDSLANKAKQKNLGLC